MTHVVRTSLASLAPVWGGSLVAGYGVFIGVAVRPHAVGDAAWKAPLANAGSGAAAVVSIGAHS